MTTPTGKHERQYVRAFSDAFDAYVEGGQWQDHLSRLGVSPPHEQVDEKFADKAWKTSNMRAAGEVGERYRMSTIAALALGDSVAQETGAFGAKRVGWPEDRGYPVLRWWFGIARRREVWLERWNALDIVGQRELHERAAQGWYRLNPDQEARVLHACRYHVPGNAMDDLARDALVAMGYVEDETLTEVPLGIWEFLKRGIPLPN
ncbi:MAG: hypothetical protein ABI885_24265 [Gammaproteobacteria bacterium]